MIFVTSGHVDHGKTALLEALTGKNTAHLPEEKKRGLTIDLGYAYLPIENEVLGFIDVPGHQRFLSNMLAGLGGVEYALLVISAEEGIKPQTVEHFTILRLLNFRQIIVVITKSDRVESAQITQLMLQIKADFPPLVDSPFFVTSAYTGQGISELKQFLIGLNQQNKLSDKPFRYAIDRVFSLKGTGTVVTGTAIAGKISIGEELFLCNGQKVKVRAIHAQNQVAEVGYAGQRLALNVVNVDKSVLQRGQWLTELNPEFSTERITVRLLPNQMMNENSVVHIYHFASHIMGKVNLLNVTQAQPNQSVLAEIILDQPLHIANNDKLILRNGDDSETLAGAIVLEIQSPKRYKRTEKRLAYLNALNETQLFSEKIANYLENKIYEIAYLAWSEQKFEYEIDLYGEKIGKWLVGVEFKQRLQQQILQKLQEYHQHHQDQLGVTKSRLLRITAPELPETLFSRVIEQLIEKGELSQTRGWIHTPDHKIALTEAENAVWESIQPLFANTNQALWVRDIATELGKDEQAIRNLLYKIGKLGYVIPIVKDRFLMYEQVVNFANQIKAFIAEYGEISVNQFRDQIGYGRKVTVQLMEYYDRVGLLRRKGNVHLLRDANTY